MVSNKRFVSLKSQIILSTIVPVAIIFLIIIPVIFNYMFDSFQETAKAESLLIGQKYAVSFENKINTALNYLSITASGLEMHAGTATADRKTLQKTIFNIFENYQIDGTSIMFERNMYDGRDKEYVGTDYGTETSGRICYYFYLKDGKTAYLPQAMLNDIEFDEPYYASAKQADKPVCNPPIAYEIDGKKISMFTLSYPLHSKAKNGEFIGAVTVDVFLEDLYAKLRSEKIYETGYIVIANDKNQIIYNPVFEYIGKTRQEVGATYPLPAKDETVVYANAASTVNGKECLVTTVPVYIPQTDSFFYISVAVPTSEIYAGALRLIAMLSVFSIFVIAVIGSILYYLIRLKMATIKKITESANKIAAGQMDIGAEFDAIDENVKTVDEVYTLSIAIKKMLTQLNEVQTFKLETLALKLEKEKAEAQTQAKSDFLAKMSHEIRTPMNAIMGMSELILRKELPHDIYENALGIKTASSNLLSIINDILDFSKIESGKMEIVETEYMFASLVNDVISIIRMRLTEKPIQFAVNIDCRIPALLIGDEVRIRQVFLNLLSNAVKYTQEGFISLTVNGTTDGDTVYLTAEIADSGVGIREEDIGKLFGDFAQVDQVKNKEIEGTGLGLAITRRLCLAMGGNITVRSEYGKGTVFTFMLPQKFNIYKPFATVENLSQKSVLLYEPRPVYANSLAATLENLGIKYATAPNVSTFFEEINPFSHIFVPVFLYDSVKHITKKLNNRNQLVLLSDISETFVTNDARILNIPAHSLSIANVLNDVYDNFGESREAGVSFIAPTAKVLIVDDISANLKVAEGLMSPYEMQIDICKSGQAAVEMVASRQYDLVFMDHMMPEMDGIEAAFRIRAMEGEYFQNLPIVALTANAMSGVKEMFVQNGMNDFLAKPIETAKLDAILKKWIPREKREKANATKKLAPADENWRNKTNTFIAALKTVPDLSVDRALSIVGGSVEAYERAVKLTVRLMPENIAKLNFLINDGDLSLYAIEVHGIKGILNNIGAYSLGKTALELENLSKADNLEACKEYHPAFNKKLAKFLETITPLIEETTAADKSKGDMAQLLRVLPKIEEAANFFDSALALEILSPIGEHSYGQKPDEIIAGLTAAFEQFDFDKTAELIEKLKGEVTADD